MMIVLKMKSPENLSLSEKFVNFSLGDNSVYLTPSHQREERFFKVRLEIGN